MININKVDLLFGNPISITSNVAIKVPTVETMCKEPNFGVYTQVFTVTTRELFSGVREVDKFEDKYPTIWDMAFDAEGSLILGQMLGHPSGMNILIDSMAYWTGLKSEAFQPLTNKKIVNQDVGLIIDEKKFKEICELIQIITCYEKNLDLVAPKNMSNRKWGIWEKSYKGRMRNAQRNSRTIADKILVLSVSFDAYIPLNEIQNMTIYHFNKLCEAVSQKESYRTQWDIKLSPKFESKGSLRHWRELIKL